MPVKFRITSFCCYLDIYVLVICIQVYPVLIGKSPPDFSKAKSRENSEPKIQWTESKWAEHHWVKSRERKSVCRK